MKKRFKKISIGFISVLFFLLVAGFFLIQWKTYHPSDQARSIVQDMKVTEKDARLYFPGKKDAPVLIFYTGALVEPQAYAYLGQGLAQKGYSVYILHSPLNLPVLNADQAKEVIQGEGLDASKVYLGGHSLGGVMAAREAQQGGVAGLVLLASYPDSKVDLSRSSLKVLSLVGSQDQVLKWKSYEESKQRLPESTRYVSIDGGNHADFGDYGPQEGDGKSFLTKEDAQKQIINAIDQIMKG